MANQFEYVYVAWQQETVGITTYPAHIVGVYTSRRIANKECGHIPHIRIQRISLDAR
jgi:hypothetical protein